MPRPRMRRRVAFQPNVSYFKPRGIPLRELEEVTLSFEEMEALKLVDIQQLGQTEAAKKMNISQPTFFRELDMARKKITDALVNGKAIKIENK